MSEVGATIPKVITIRLEDDSEKEGYVCWQGLLIRENLAIAIMNGHIEIQVLKATADEKLYDLVHSSDSLFEVQHDDDQVILDDFARLTFAEFVVKHPNIGFRND